MKTNMTPFNQINYNLFKIKNIKYLKLIDKTIKLFPNISIFYPDKFIESDKYSNEIFRIDDGKIVFYIKII
jgi:hypothetical protein